jgi:hypothetical protein
MVTDLVWLPSGKQLLLLFFGVWNGVRDPGGQIGVMSVDSGDFRQITNDLMPHGGISPSADGTTIATLLQQSGSEVGFYDATGNTLISTSHLPQRRGNLVWLNEDQVLGSFPWFTTLRRDTGEVADIELHFPSSVRSNGTWSSDSSNTTPAVCPDDQLLVTGTINEVDQLFFIDAHGQYVKTLVKTRGDAMFCNAENNIAYYAEGKPPDRFIWSLPLAGGTPHKLMSISPKAPIVYARDGRNAAYVLDDAGKSTATVINLDQRKVTTELPLVDHGPETLPHFTPDGKALAYVEQGKQGFALALQPLDGSPSRLLTTWFKSSILDFGWSPSGKSLAILWDRSTSDAAVITDQSKKPRE